MSDKPQSPSAEETLFEQQVAAKAVRKLRAQSRGPGDVWFGLGMTGLIGWSIAVPTVVGALLGLWIDARNPGGHSWTLALLVAGLCIGCANAWRWVNEQSRAMQDDAGEPK
ncbi:MAG: AtpZ/AtpI family protein [Acidobacteriota bacterium]|nr:AtpZ/AtpI family protein [Acidobacteriota bacterium]